MVNVTTNIYMFDGKISVGNFWIDDVDDLSRASKEFGRLQHFIYGNSDAWGYLVDGKYILVTDFTLRD